MSQVIKDPVKHGRRIREIADLEEATLQRKCVITGRGVMMPAAWVFQMPGQEIGIYIKNGLWIYKGIEKANQGKRKEKDEKWEIGTNPRK